MDIVLVLDVSGSMDGQIAFYDYQKTEKTSWSAKDFYFTGTTYYEKIGEEYYPVSCQSKWVPDKYFGHDEYWLEANGQSLGNTGKWGEQLYSGPLYTYGKVSGSEMSKLAAMKTAVNNFIESVAAQKNGNTPVAHRISIVKFAGDQSDKVSNDTYRDGKNIYNYTQKVTELTDVTDEGSVDSLKDAVNALTAGGATAADWGMQKAEDVLTKRDNKENPSIVIMFTDGQPNHHRDYDNAVAGAAVDTAKTLKAGGTKVYTIGMFEGADPGDIDGDFNKYMNGVSSNYPEAVKADNDSGVTLGTRAEGSNYYFKADNAGALDQVFQTISQSTTTTSPLDASAVVVDNVPSNFALNEESVQVYTADCTGKNSEGELTWKDTLEKSNIIPNIPEDKNEDGSQTISTTGFNFSGNWCGLDSNNEATGKKLIIEFTIKCTNYGGTQPTNAGAYIKAGKEANEEPIISLEDPEVPVTVQLPEGSDPYTDTKVYDGAGFDIKNEIGKIVANLVPVDGTKNKFIDLTYEIKDNEGNTVGTYTIPAGQDTGTWSDTSTNITTGPNFGNYTYKITVTGQDKKQTSNNDSKECTATFTIKKRDVTFTGKSDSLTWTGDEQTITDITAPTDLVPGHTYEGGLNYVAKGTDTGTYDGKFTGTAIIKDADGTNVTANYNVKTEPGTLTITNSTSTATVTFKIVGGKWSDDTAEDKTVQVTLTNGKGSLAGVTIPTGSPSEDYTGDGAWSSSDENITGAPVETTEITKDTTFTLTYSKIEPVVTNVNVTFKIVGGKWSNGTTNPITESVQLTDGTGSLAYVTIPTGSPSDGYTGDGVWSNDAGITGDPVNTTEITKETTFTLTFPQKPAAPVEWDVSRSKIASVLTKNSNGEWTTTVKLTLPTVKQEGTQTIAISEGSYVIDQIGKNFTLVGIGGSGLENGSFTMTVGGKEITGEAINGHTVNFGQKDDGSYRYTVDYAETNSTFTWNINEDVYAGTEVTLSYKLKLTNPDKTAGTHGVKDLNGDGIVDDTNAAFTENDKKNALYTNEKAALYIKENNQEKEIAVFLKPSVSYTVSSGNSGSHSGGSRPSLNTKDHYGYIIGYPVDYYTGQPTTDQTKKPVRPEGKITRAEVATIYFRMLTDESRTKFWSQNSGYSDVKTGDWFNNAVSTLSNAGIIAGYEDGSFRPNGYITRAEFATIAARFFDVTYNGKDLFPDISGHWAKDYINQAANKGFVNGYEDGTFKPDRNITRAEAVTLVNRTLDRHPDKNHFTKDMLVWPDNMDQTKWYYADMQEATNSHTYQMKENSDKTKYENWTKTLPIRNWEALEKAWSNANSSQGNGNVV